MAFAGNCAVQPNNPQALPVDRIVQGARGGQVAPFGEGCSKRLSPIVIARDAEHWKGQPRQQPDGDHVFRIKAAIGELSGHQQAVGARL